MKPMIYLRTYKAQRRLSPEAEIVDAREPIGYRLCASGYLLTERAPLHELLDSKKKVPSPAQLFAHC